MRAIQHVDGHKLESGVRGKTAGRGVVGEHLKDLEGGAGSVEVVTGVVVVEA